MDTNNNGNGATTPEQQALFFSDINQGVPKEVKGPLGNQICRLPELDVPIVTIADYANHFTSLAKGGGLLDIVKGSVDIPPYVQAFSKISYMPNAQQQQFGIQQWPGLPPQTLQKLAKEHVGPQMIISMRVDDVISYSELSTRPWRPGWHIVTRDVSESPDASTRRDIRDAEQFLLQGGSGRIYEDPRKRDALYRENFSTFLAEIVRNSLTFDGIAIWLDSNEKGIVQSFAPMPAQNIRLLARKDKNIGMVTDELDFYGTDPEKKELNLDPNIFAVAVDEMGNIVSRFRRDQLIWYRRNPRLDVEIGNYGFPELEAALMVVTGFSNAVKFNADIFDQNSIPKGILAIKGNFTQRQFDALGRIWDNLQRGSRTDWTLPAIQLSEKGEIEVISLEPLRKESAYYANLINLFMGILATIYRFPVHRLGYKISGTQRDMRPDIPKALEESDDIGLPVLLSHIENIINIYLLNAWPHLKFEFTHKRPKEDARLYEAQLLSMTWGEKRAMVGLQPAVKGAKSPLTKEIAELMDIAPVDPSLTGIYQAILASKSKGLQMDASVDPPVTAEGGKGGSAATPGNKFTSNKDPAVSEQHGATSGVRRDSRIEKDKARAGHPPNLFSGTRSPGGTGTPDTT